MLVLASGRGIRFGGEIPKVYRECRGVSLLVLALRRLRQADADAEMIVAVEPGERERFVAPQQAELLACGVARIVDGGATRQASMRAALAASDPRRPLVLVHDAARPLVPVAATRAALALARTCAGVALAMPVDDTLKRADAEGRVHETLARDGVWRAQTPQILQRDKLLIALETATRDGFEGTDDVSLLEHSGFEVRLVAGAPGNLKVTRPDDLRLVEALLAAEEETPA